MRKKIDVFDYSEQIMKALRKGILLNTNGDKFNSMVISWGTSASSGENPPLQSMSVKTAIPKHSWI